MRVCVYVCECEKGNVCVRVNSRGRLCVCVYV